MLAVYDEMFLNIFCLMRLASVMMGKRIERVITLFINITWMISISTNIHCLNRFYQGI